MPRDDLRIEQWPIDRLLPYAANARTHDPEQIAQIAASIAEFGFNVPCLVDERGVLIAGHGRLLAARKLGITDIPVIRLDHLTDAQARAYRICDNQLVLNGAWNEDLLAAELARLKEDGLSLDLLGFADDELDRLLASIDEGNAAPQDSGEDAVPDPPAEPITRPGDLWLLGAHRLFCGDALVLADVEKVLDGKRAGMTFSDPPYNVNYANSAKDKLRGKNRPILNDALGPKGFGAFLYDACVNILTMTEGAVYICMSSSELDTLQKAFRDAGGHWSTFIVWAKNTFTLGRSDYQRQYEALLYGWPEGKDHYWCGDRDQGDVWFFDKPAKNDLHPTMKPVALVERAIKNSSRRDAIVLDPFGGSGTTLIACCNTGRKARLIELDSRYCDVIVERWQTLTGQKATLEASGERFDDLARSSGQPSGAAYHGAFARGRDAA
jgi:DNA modification methylase